MNDIVIENKKIGDNHPCFIIAEISANHNNDIDLVKKMIKKAKDIGVDAIKLQTFTPDTITLNCYNDYFKIAQDSIWDGKFLYDLYKEAYMPWDYHEEIFKVAKEEDLICFSTPFDFSSVDFLEKYNPPLYKIASYEITDIPLIEYVASKNKPIIISTGIATINEIQDAVDACLRYNNSQIILLKCTSSYPTPLSSMNLKTIPNIKNTFNTLAGLSDHSLGIIAPITAVALGANVIEKHFVLDKSIKTPDSSFSLDCAEFEEMIKYIRDCECAMGNVNYELSDKDIKNREISRSLFVVEDVLCNDTITKDNVRSIRPGYGLPPKYYYEILGKTFSRDIKKGTPLSIKDIID